MQSPTKASTSRQRRGEGRGGAAQLVYTVTIGTSPAGIRNDSGTDNSSQLSIS